MIYLSDETQDEVEVTKYFIQADMINHIDVEAFLKYLLDR